MTVIYAIECSINGWCYVGCTGSTLNRRMNEHRCLLRKGKHSATKMLEDWNIHGHGAFTLKVLETLPDGAHVEVRRAAELKWMDHYEAAGLLYNAQKISFGPGEGFREKAHTPEANMKRRLAQLGKPKGHGWKISATKKALGQRPSREAIMKGNKAGLLARYGKTDEIVCSAAKLEAVEVSDKEPGR